MYLTFIIRFTVGQVVLFEGSIDDWFVLQLSDDDLWTHKMSRYFKMPYFSFLMGGSISNHKKEISPVKHFWWMPHIFPFFPYCLAYLDVKPLLNMTMSRKLESTSCCVKATLRIFIVGKGNFPEYNLFLRQLKNVIFNCLQCLHSDK